MVVSALAGCSGSTINKAIESEVSDVEPETEEVTETSIEKREIEESEAEESEIESETGSETKTEVTTETEHESKIEETTKESMIEQEMENSTEAKKEDTTKVAEEKPVQEKTVHTHSWDGGTVTQAATCGSDGVMTYTCGCGETKTEVINAFGHNWVAQTTVVHHDAEGVYTKNRVGTQRVFYCNCGEVFYNFADLENHDPNNFHGYSVWDEPTYETGWFEISPAWDEEVTTGYICSICGATQ
jgi:hypothetical protein